MKIFVGRSFDKNDENLYFAFRNYFESLENLNLQFISAENPALARISDKVVGKMEGCDLFVGILSKKKRYAFKSYFEYFDIKKWSYATSTWVIQESGYAFGKGLKVILLVEDGVDIPLSDIMGDTEKIIFTREKISECFPKLNHIFSNLVKVSGEKSGDYKQLNASLAVADTEVIEKIESELKKDSSPWEVPFDKFMSNLNTESFQEADKNWSEFESEYFTSDKTDGEKEKLRINLLLKGKAELGDITAYNSLNAGLLGSNGYLCALALSDIHRKRREYKRAEEIISKQLENENDKNRRIELEFNSISLSLEQEKLENAKSNIIKVLKERELSSKQKISSLLFLGKLAKKINKPMLRLIALQRLVIEDSQNKGERFNLAFQCSELGFENCSGSISLSAFAS